MKKIMFFALFLTVAVAAKSQNLSVYIMDGPRGSVHKIDNEDYYRFTFRITGLANDAAVKQFIENCKSVPGIIDASVKEIDNTGFRSVMLRLNDKKDDEFFKTLMTKTGIKKIYYQEKEYSPDNLEQLKQDRAKNNSQNPSSRKQAK